MERVEIARQLKANTLTGEGTLQQARNAIKNALIRSMPVPDEEREPQEEDTGIIEVAKYLIITISKFGLNEREAWALTPRKFGLLNDAYLTVNGMKKEAAMSLSQLP